MRRTTIVILVLLLIGLGLRVWDLAGQSIWWDEAFTYQVTSHGLENLWHMLQTGDRNPPLYFLGVGLWGAAVGWSEFSLRFVSVIWSVLGLAFLSNLTRRLFGAHAAVWAVAVAALAPALTVYAQEARMYSTFFALTAATLYFGIRCVDRGSDVGHKAISTKSPSVGGIQHFVFFLVCESALLLTHYFAIPIVLAINLFVLSALLRKRADFNVYLKWFGSQVLVILPLLIWMLILFSTPGSLLLAHESLPAIATFIYQVSILWLSGVRDLNGAQMQLVLPALGLVAMAVIGAWRVNPRSTQRTLAFGLVSLALAFILTSVLTSFHPRYLLPYSIPLFVLVGGALSNLKFGRGWMTEARERRSAWVGMIAGGLTLLILVFLTVNGWQTASSPAYAKDDARSVAAYLKQNAAAGDVILVEANDYTLSYYDHGLAQTKMITAATESEAFKQLLESIGAAKRVWLPHWDVSTQDPRGYWRFLLERAGSMQDWTTYHGYELYQYGMQSALREPVLDKTMAEGSTYAGEWSGVDGQESDGALAFAVKWLDSQEMDPRRKVSMRLIDPAGAQISAVDVPLLDEQGQSAALTAPNNPIVNYYVLPIPPGTLPLTYTIVAQAFPMQGDSHSAAATPVELPIATIHLPPRLDTADPYRTWSGYHWQAPPVSEFVPGLTLESFVVGNQSPQPLDEVDVTLRWRKTGDAGDVAPRLRLVQGNRVWAEVGSPVFERDYPVGRWVEGETVLDRRKIPYPPVRGTVELQVGHADQWMTLTKLALDESTLSFQPPEMQHTQSAQFDDVADLMGFDLKSNSLAPDRPLDLTLYWRAANHEPITTPYTIFTQLLAPDGHIVAQHDMPPNTPVTGWVPGQIVATKHLVNVVDPTYRGPATLIVGWYNSASIERVPVTSGGNYVTLQVPIRVEEK